MACNCITEMDAKLADLNTRLVTSFGWRRQTGETFILPTIGTEKLETRKRSKGVTVVPTFCPFCGIRYQPLPAESSQTAEPASAEAEGVDRLSAMGVAHGLSADDADTMAGWIDREAC
jgi:hypothetical protein